MKEQAVVIATRNRPEDLNRTLQSIEATDTAHKLLVVIVDASDPDQAEHNRTSATSFDAFQSLYCVFPGAPAGTRQRNYGIDQLPSSVRIVHFIDDDVTVHPKYFDHLATVLDTYPRVGGVGGLITETTQQPASRPPWTHRLFLLDAPGGTVLPSGHAASYSNLQSLYPVQWLSTCASSYRRDVFSQYRFDPAVEGPSPRLEDRDFSYRVHQSWTLLFQPRARLTHYPSSVNRRSVRQWWKEAVVRRYWFMEKNIRHPLRKPAFWWATLGQTVALVTSPKQQKWKALRGHLDGINTVLRRAHPLLQKA